MAREYANIALTGFMAAGKTVVGRRLARSLGWSFVDLDAVIESSEGSAVREIFAGRGEGYFREREKAALAHVLEETGQVIALGGGAVVDPDNRARLKERSLLIWLKVSPGTVLDRTRGDDERPLLQQRGKAASEGDTAVFGGATPSVSPAEADAAKLGRIEELLAQREHIYAEADVTVDTDGLAVDHVVQRIQQHLCKP